MDGEEHPLALKSMNPINKRLILQYSLTFCPFPQVGEEVVPLGTQQTERERQGKSPPFGALPLCTSCFWLVADLFGPDKESAMTFSTPSWRARIPHDQPNALGQAQFQATHKVGCAGPKRRCRIEEARDNLTELTPRLSPLKQMGLA